MRLAQRLSVLVPVRPAPLLGRRRGVTARRTRRVIPAALADLGLAVPVHRRRVGPAARATTGPAVRVGPALPATTGRGRVPGGPGDHGPGGPGDRGPGGPGGPGAWHGDPHRGYFHNAPWGDGPAPWGNGEPPRPAWDRPLPPPGGRWNYGPINYYGYQETPMWNPGYNQWGFNFFGVWVPL